MKLKGALFAVLLAVGVVGCTSDDEPKVEIDSEVVSAYASGEVTGCFKLANREYFSKDISKAERNRSGIDGVVDPLEFDPSDRTILFKDGKTITPLHWTPYDNNSNTLHLLHEVWNVYIKMTESKDELFVGVPFRFDKTNNFLWTPDRTYVVMVMKGDKIRLNYKNEDGRSSIVYDYIKYPISQSELDQCTVFDSNLEAYRYVAETAKDFFGSKLELNKVYPSATGIIDIDDLLERLDKGMY